MNKLLMSMGLLLLLLSVSMVSAASFDLTSSEIKEEVSDYRVGLNIGTEYFVVTVLDDGFFFNFDTGLSVDHVVDFSIIDFVGFCKDYFFIERGSVERVGLLSTTFGVPAGRWVDMPLLGVSD